MVGSATFTIVVSSSAIETPRMSTASAIHELRGVASGLADAGELVTEDAPLGERDNPDDRRSPEGFVCCGRDICAYVTVLGATIAPATKRAGAPGRN